MGRLAPNETSPFLAENFSANISLISLPLDTATMPLSITSLRNGGSQQHNLLKISAKFLHDSDISSLLLPGYNGDGVALLAR